MRAYLGLPTVLGASTSAPACSRSQWLHYGHQLPGTSCAVSSQRSGSGPAAPATPWLRLIFDAGLITPAVCPLTPRTKRRAPHARSVLPTFLRIRGSILA